MKASQWPANKIERRPVSKLKVNPRNSRVHSDEQVEMIARSIDQWGWTTPILVDAKDVLIAGEGRLRAAISRSIDTVPVIVARGWSDEQKRAYLIADNRLTELGEWDEELLRIELDALRVGGFDIDLTGFSLDEMLRSLESDDEPGVDDDAPEPPKKPVAKRGDVWTLGDHRLVCGDATEKADVGRLLGSTAVNLMVTDPPYGQDYDPTWRREAGVSRNRKKHGEFDDSVANWEDAISLFPGNIIYLWHAARSAIDSAAGIENRGFEIRSQIIWSKDRFALSRGNYHWQHEPCWYAVRVGASAGWCGSRNQSTVWPIPAREDKGHGHGTQKPVECMRRPMINNSKPGDAVYDPFVGSGTSIIAAETANRLCLAMEIEPGYVDVSIQRWQELTGGKASRVGGGQSGACKAVRAKAPAASP